MVRMKLTKDEFNEKELDVEIEERQFEPYRGEIPKTGTILIHRITKMWWSTAGDGTSMIKVLAVAEQNKGSLAEYNGLTTWEYLVFKPTGAFRYQPFLQNFDITLKDVRFKMDVEADDDNIGTPINSIADWEVGSDDALCRIVIKRDRFDDEWRSKVDVGGWLPYEESEPDDDEDEDEEPARPTSRTRGRSSQGGRQAKPSARRRAEPDEDEDEDEDIEDDEEVDDEYDEEDEEADADEEEEAEEEPPARPTRRTKSATSARTTQSRTSTSRRAAPATRAKDGGRTRGGTKSRTSSRAPRGGGSTDEPPF